MFRLRTFGGLWLERDHQRVGGASPRRLGLLAAVVASGNRGISRERLLLLLWPEATDTKARHALAQTLYSFQRDLDEELLRSQATELLVDPERLGSDHSDFLAAQAAGELERAAELYTGPFLDGFYVPGADEFERWTEVERARLRELAIQAIEGAARQAGEAGRIEAASGYWRRLTVLAPLNSRVALGYMTSLADAGDVAGAIQHGRNHELTRRQEVGAQPDPAVVALLGRLTSGGWRPIGGGAAGPAAPDSAADVDRGSAASAVVAKPSRRGRRWMIGAALAASAALAVWKLSPIIGGRSGFPVGSVVVMADPVDLTGDPSLARALASAAAVGLQQSRHVTLLSRARIADALQRMGRTGDQVLTDSLALEVAARSNARAVFTLTVARLSGEYVLTGRLLSPAGGSDIAVDRASAPGLGGIVGALDGLVRKTLARAGDPLGERDSLRLLPEVTTGSLEALKLYADGLDAWRHSKYEQALQLFNRSVALDSGFALAHVQLGAASYFDNDRPGGDAHYAAALRFRSRLTFREQLALDSRLAGARGDRAEAIRIDAILANRYPSRETWFSYGVSLKQSDRCREAIPALRRSLQFDSAAANSQINLASCYKTLGENRLALDAYAAAERIDSTALVTNFINHEWGSVFIRLGRFTEAEAAFSRMLALPEANDRARGHRSLAYLDMLRGRYVEAIRELTAAVSLSHEPGAGLSLLRNELLLADAYLARDEPGPAGRELDEAIHISRSQYVEPAFLALLGRELVRANRIPDGRAVLRQLESVVKPGNAGDRSARGLLSAELDLARGAPGAAADAIRNDLDTHLIEWRTGLVGRILAGRGVLDSALTATAAFAGLDGFGKDNQGEWELASLDVARIAEALGDSATARAALQSFLDRWKEADPDLRVLRETRLHLARLRGKAGG